MTTKAWLFEWQVLARYLLYRNRFDKTPQQFPGPIVAAFGGVAGAHLKRPVLRQSARNSH